MIKLKGGTASAMSAENPVLADRQPGFARTNNGGILKIGDGVTPWNDLPGVVDSNSVRYYTETNLAMPEVNNRASWYISASTHQLTHYPIVQIFEVATGEMVLADVEVDNSYNVTIYMINTNSSIIGTGTYRVVMVG